MFERVGTLSLQQRPQDFDRDSDMVQMEGEYVATLFQLELQDVAKGF